MSEKSLYVTGGTAMKSNATKIFVLTCALGLLFSATSLRAQVSGATLSGTITDAQGGAVVGAKISAKNGATGVTTESTTNSSGAYSIVNLLPADYDVSVSAAGFRTATSKVTLIVGGQQALNVALTVGEVSQTVEVTGAAPIVETTNATLSGEVVGAQIQELPLDGRDWVSLAELQPGVVSVRPHEEVTAPGGSTRGLGIQLTINGARPQQNVYRLNGVIVNDYSNAGPGNVLGKNAGVDAIQEFSVLSSNYSAEYGFTSAGVINAITKSGTNSFHGSVYEFMRNSALDAKDRFEDPSPQNPAGIAKGNFVRNQFGASAGWKVLKDRAFLFGNFEGLRQVQAVPNQVAVLTANARLGILNTIDPVTHVVSQLPATLAGTPGGPPCPFTTGPGPIDPNGMTNEAPGQAAVCVDNFIFSEINPAGTPAGVLAPLPNGALITPNNNDDAYYNTDLGQYSSDNYATVRGDLKISDKDTLTGTWYRDTSTWRKPGNYNSPSLSYSGYQVPHGAYTLEESHILSSSLVNTVRLGLDTSNLFSPSFSNDNPVTHATTLNGKQIGILPGWVAGGGSIGGNGNSGNSTTVNGAQSGFTGAAGFSARTAKIEFFDDVSKTFGKHTLKLGFMAVLDHENWLDGPALMGGGGPSFSALSTKTTNSGGICDPNQAGGAPLYCVAVAGVGGGVASYLMDIPKSVRMPVEEPFTPGATVHHYRTNIYAGYVQDDWKMFSNLTVNLGLRYEMSTIPWEVDDKINNLETLSQDLPVNGCTANSLGIGLCAGFYHQTFQHNPTLKNFEPRIGFAWDPFHNGKTSVRGGIGMFDVLPLAYMFALNSMQTAPNGSEVDLAYTGVNGQGRFPTLEALDGLPGSSVSNSGAALRWQYVEPRPKRNDVVQYNLNIQRQLTPSVSIMVAYAGSRSWHDPYQTDDLNTVFPYKVGDRWLFPNPVGSGCLPGPPNCSATDTALGLPSTFNSGGQISNNQGIVPGLLINSHTAQIQSTIFPVQSWYNSLQVKVDKRMSHGLYVGGAFTWGKSFDTSSSSFASDNYSNNPSAITPWYDMSINKGLSDFDVSRNLSINGLWQVPIPASFHGPLAWAAGGWGLGANFEASDGIPLWPLMVGGDSLGMDITGAFAIPDFKPGCQATNPSTGRTGALQYINPACYILPQAPSMAFYSAPKPLGCDPQVNPKTGIAAFPFPTCINLLGNDPRNAIIGPGLLNLDFSMTKDNHIRKISEAANLQFRAEFFNITNRVNYAPPIANNLGSLNPDGSVAQNFGILTKTQVAMREIQFALKFLW
jgi:carboxypeptidase family protein